MDVVKLLDGVVVSTDYVTSISNPAIVFIRALSMSYVDAARIFSDPNITGVIQYAGTEYLGYTKLLALSQEPGAIKVALQKE